MINISLLIILKIVYFFWSRYSDVLEDLLNIQENPNIKFKTFFTDLFYFKTVKVKPIKLWKTTQVLFFFKSMKIKHLRLFSFIKLLFLVCLFYKNIKYKCRLHISQNHGPRCKYHNKIFLSLDLKVVENFPQTEIF